MEQKLCKLKSHAIDHIRYYTGMTRPRSRRRHELREQVHQDIEFSLSPAESNEIADDAQENFKVDNAQVNESLQCWKSCDDEYATTCKLYTTNDHTLLCPIMHEPPCSAQLEDIPETWPLADNTSANTVRLECAHTFFVPALVLHFLVTDMRCPVCRTGASCKMDIACVPLCVRESYLAKLKALQQRTVQEDMINMLPEHIANVLSELELEMRIFTTSAQDTTVLIHNATAKTRIVFDAGHVADIQSRSLTASNNNLDQPQFDMITNFAVHRSFQRLIRSMLGRQLLQQTPSSVRFALTHPLLPLAFKTNLLTVNEVWNLYFAQGATSDMGIPFFCTNIGGTEPLAFLRCALCSIANTTSVTIDVNIHVIINIISYVSDVLESIQAGVQQHLQLLEADFPILDYANELSPANADV
jgi:hypothetical protein